MIDDVNPYERFAGGKLILRDELAIDRTVLANERTFLSYLRTGLAFGAVSGTLLKFFDSTSSHVLGIFFGILVPLTIGFGIWRSVSMHRRISAVRRVLTPTESEQTQAES